MCPAREPWWSGAHTLQKATLDLEARKITASLQVDGLPLAGALEAAGALSEEDRLHLVRSAGTRFHRLPL